MLRPLPIDPLLPEIIATLTASPSLVLRAPPGAGKTTRVPAALLDAGLANGKHVVVLEPRRIAARAAAEFVARERNGQVGAEVGYRVRFETRGDARTRLWFLTEGVLGRQLVSDPFLEQVGVIVLDEFHERHLQGDVALAVIRELQATVRPDLKLLVMSATLDTARLAEYLDDCPVLTSEGRAHPVRTTYAAPGDDRPLPGRIATALRQLFDDPAEEGDVLVFLPGIAEINHTATAIEPITAARKADVVPLHASLPLEAQQRAIVRGPRRRVVLATNVAETALTIEGVTAVIDSGVARVARLDARRGINVLRTVPISRAAADQRTGRAGRLGPGRCIRLWSEGEHHARRAHEVPEILRLDLTATVLELRAWGARDPLTVHWLDAPPAAALEHADRLLVQLGAIDAHIGQLTPIGSRLLALAVPPRIARILVEAEHRGIAGAGAAIAALAAERDICVQRHGDAPPPWPTGPSDLLLRLELLAEVVRGGVNAAQCRVRGLDPRRVRAVEQARQQLCRALQVPAHLRLDADPDTLLRCTLAGFPDRVVKRRSPGSARGVMVGATGVVLSDQSIVHEAELFVAVDVEAGARRKHAEALVHLASAVNREWLSDTVPGGIATVCELLFDAAGERVVERVQQRYLDLVLDEQVRADVDRERAGVLLAEHARRTPDRAVRVGAADESLLERIRFLARARPDLGLPDDPATLLADTAALLCAGRRSFAEVRAADLLGALRNGLTPPQRHRLDREAPAEFDLPSGRRVRVVYERDKPPAVAARIQELFGLTATPRLAGGRVPLVIQILAPNQRPVQITDDLESFWRRTYPEVRKQLRGRYPKHAWPDDPLTATPTARVRRTR